MTFNLKFDPNIYFYGIPPEEEHAPIHLALFNQNGLSPFQNSEAARMLVWKGLLDCMVANFSRPLTIDLYYLAGRNLFKTRQRVDSLARVLVIPGSIRQLEEDEEGRKLDESSKEFRSTQTLCFWFPKFKVKESKFNSNVEHAQTENLHCLSLANDTGLMLNLDYNGPQGNFKKSIQLVWNPKLNVTYTLVMYLNNVRSLEDLTRFVQVELKNPTAKLVERHQEVVREPCEPSEAYSPNLSEHFPSSLEGCNSSTFKARETVVFESKLPFSNETDQFASEACNGWEEKNGLFNVNRKEHSLWWSDPGKNKIMPLAKHWLSDPFCSVLTSIKVQKNFQVDAELSLSFGIDSLPT